MAERDYRRLTPWRRRPTRWISAAVPRTSLWLGKDHLLSIDSVNYTEEYKRFYFRDIQSIAIRQTKRRLVWNSALGLLVMMMLGGIFLGGNRTALLVVASILAVPLIINNVLGTTCTVYLKTAVQVEEIAALSRLRRATRVMNMIRPLITAAQGEVSSEDLSALKRNMADVAPSPIVTSPLNLTRGDESG